MKPVDLQVIVPKSHEAVKIQQNLKNGSQVQQNLLSVQSTEQLKNLKRKVVKRSKTKDIRLDIKEKPKQKKYGSKHRAMKQKQKEKNPKTKNKRILNRHIDIKI